MAIRAAFATKEGKPYRFHLDDTLQLFSPRKADAIFPDEMICHFQHRSALSNGCMST
jgi:hypothetical protein